MGCTQSQRKGRSLGGLQNISVSDFQFDPIEPVKPIKPINLTNTINLHNSISQLELPDPIDFPDEPLKTEPKIPTNQKKPLMKSASEGKLGTTKSQSVSPARWSHEFSPKIFTLRKDVTTQHLSDLPSAHKKSSSLPKEFRKATKRFSMKEKIWTMAEVKKEIMGRSFDEASAIAAQHNMTIRAISMGGDHFPFVGYVPGRINVEIISGIITGILTDG
jgi:hypothetical protein